MAEASNYQAVLADFSFGSGAFGESFAASPVVMSRISLASWLGSRGRAGFFTVAGP